MPSKDTLPTLNAYISVRDAPAALAFYEAAFGARRAGPTLRAGGVVVHAELRFGDAALMLSEEDAERGAPSPLTLGDATARLNLTVEDADAVFAAATAAGAEIVIPLADQFYGQRSGRLRDPFGHLWIISQPLETLDEAEMQRRLDDMTRAN